MSNKLSTKEYINAVIAKGDITAEQIASMRSWVIDCQPVVDEDVEDEINNASVFSILRWVHRNWDGGIEGFIQAGDFIEWTPCGR